nr:zinc finger, CCHC-type [Tanacetum cinerariifolium]
MRDENSIHTSGDYSRPSYEGYRNTIELPYGNNVVPRRSDTIRRRESRDIKWDDPNNRAHSDTKEGGGVDEESKESEEQVEEEEDDP